MITTVDPHNLKPTDLMTGSIVIPELLGIPGLPEHIVSLNLKIDQGFVQIDCSFLVEKQLLDSMERAWEPAFAQYRLVKIEQAKVSEQQPVAA